MKPGQVLGMHRVIGLLLMSWMLVSCGTGPLPDQLESPESDEFVHSINDVVDLLKISLQLDKQIEEAFPARNLRPAAEQRQFIGARKKTLLVDDSGAKWLFKSSGSLGEEGSDVIRCTTDLLTLCGVKVPRAYAYEFSGQKGTVEIYVEDSINLIDYDLFKLAPDHLEYLGNHQVVDWLVSDLDRNHGDFILVEITGELYGLDMDGSFDEIDVTELTDSSIGWIYRFVREEYLSGRSTPSFTSPQGLIGYFVSLDDSVIVGLFDGHDKPSRKLDCEAIIQSILGKKSRLLRDFEAYYASLAESVDRLDDFHAAWSDEQVTKSTEAYRRHVAEFLEERISMQREFLDGESVDFL
jgi:hypothetical protein